MLRLTILLLAVIGIAMLVVGQDADTKIAAAAPRAVDPALLVAPKSAPVAVAEYDRPASVDRLLGVEPRPVAAKTAAAQAEAVAEPASLEVQVAAAGEIIDAPPRRREYLSVNDEVGARAAAQAERAAAMAAAAGADVREGVDAALAEATIAMVTGSRVNVRSGPSTSNGVVGQVVFGETAEVLSANENGWVKIRIQGDGVEGYVSAKFLDGSGLSN